MNAWELKEPSIWNGYTYDWLEADIGISVIEAVGAFYLGLLPDRVDGSAERPHYNLGDPSCLPVEEPPA